MYKGSGITKSIQRKWNESPAMDTKDLVSSRARTSHAVIDLEDDIHFVIDSDLNFSTSLPDRKPIEMPRKTYSKKNPLVMHPFISSDPLESFRGNLSTKAISYSPITLKSSSPSSVSKPPLRKRKKDSDSSNNSETLPPRKVQKKNMTVKLNKSTSQSCTAKVPRQPRSRSLGNTPMNKHDRSLGNTPVNKHDRSSDSDIEIVAVYNKPSTSMGLASKLGSVRKFENGQGHLTSKNSRRCFESEVDDEVVINEADIAPYMPANPSIFPDVTSRTNSMRWLSASGKISVPNYEPNGLVGSEVAQTKSADVDVKPLFLPEMKLIEQKRPIGKGELKKLYENLNEISWAHEKSFKNLLCSPDDTRYSKRCSTRTVETGTKRAAKVKAAQLIARKKSKMARLNHKVKAKGMVKNKSSVVANIKKKRLSKRVVNSNDNKKVTAKSKLNSLGGNEGSDTNEETDVLYSLNPNAPIVKFEFAKPNIAKTKLRVPKTKIDAPKTKNGVSKIMPELQKVKPTMLKLKPEVQKMKPNLLKLKPDASKPKSNVFKLKPDGPKVKSNLLKLKPDEIVRKSYVAQVKPEYSPPSTSGLQKVTYSAKSASNSKNCGKPSDMKNFLKKFDNNFDFAREMQLLQGFLDENKHLYSAVQKGSKLRVSLQPLEHTKLWTSEFYEDFRRHFLDQAFRRAIENRDRDSITVMYQELLESFMNSQASNGVNNNNRVAKKKKPGEEEALRSSVRQSEGAFRYKEIVVKKHQNYMQVVLVPNEVKQNSLTVEAMKELKDAFLLAKKDPNCNAVLLNSSGKYFCTGVDLSPLVGSNKKQAAEELSNSIGDLVLTLGMFTKPLIAAVNGAAVGFGVSLLTYCDVVLASDKATFCLPAAKIGYIPEGGVTLTLPQVVGSSVASEMFLQGRRLTAEQALRYGLVSEVLWPTKLMNEVIPRLKAVIAQPLPAMEATKAMVRYHLWDKLKSHMDRERRLLCEHWLGTQCQANIKSLLQTGWLTDL